MEEPVTKLLRDIESEIYATASLFQRTLNDCHAQAFVKALEVAKKGGGESAGTGGNDRALSCNGGAGSRLMDRKGMGVKSYCWYSPDHWRRMSNLEPTSWRAVATENM